MTEAIIFDFFGVLAGSNFVPYVNTELFDYIVHDLKPMYKIGLLSNTSREIIASKPIDIDVYGLFDAVLLSADVGMAKPDPGIFVLACERLGVGPAEVIYIDDSERNLMGAHSIGMRTLLFTDNESVRAGLNGLLQA